MIRVQIRILFEIVSWVFGFGLQNQQKSFFKITDIRIAQFEEDYCKLNLTPANSNLYL